MEKEKNAAVKLSLLCHIVIAVMTFGPLVELNSLLTEETEYISFLQLISGELQELLKGLNFFGFNLEIDSTAKILVALFVLTFVCLLLYNSKKGVFVSSVYLVGSIIAYKKMDELIDELESLPLVKKGMGASIMTTGYMIMILLAILLVGFSVYEQYLKKILTEKRQETSEEKVVCPKCGKEAGASSAFCSSCGVALSTVCTECGEMLRLGAKFCTKCGKMVVTTNEEGTNKNDRV